MEYIPAAAVDNSKASNDEDGAVGGLAVQKQGPRNFLMSNSLTNLPSAKPPLNLPLSTVLNGDRKGQQSLYHSSQRGSSERKMKKSLQADLHKSITNNFHQSMSNIIFFDGNMLEALGHNHQHERPQSSNGRSKKNESQGSLRRISSNSNEISSGRPPQPRAFKAKDSSLEDKMGDKDRKKRCTEGQGEDSGAAQGRLHELIERPSFRRISQGNQNQNNKDNVRARARFNNFALNKPKSRSFIEGGQEERKSSRSRSSNQRNANCHNQQAQNKGGCIAKDAQQRDKIFLASSLASLMQDDDKSNNYLKQSRGGLDYRAVNGPTYQGKFLLSPANSKQPVSSNNQAFDNNQQIIQESNDSSRKDALQRLYPKGNSNDQDQYLSGINSEIESPKIIINEHQQEEAAGTNQEQQNQFRIIQLEEGDLQSCWGAMAEVNIGGPNGDLRGGQFMSMFKGPNSQDISQGAANSISAIEKPLELNPDGKACGLEPESLLFTARDQHDGANLEENRDIIESLNKRESHLAVVAAQQHSEMMNTQVLFQDHLVNNFYYHERLFTHRNINNYYHNGVIQMPRILQESLDRKHSLRSNPSNHKAGQILPSNNPSNTLVDQANNNHHHLNVREHFVMRRQPTINVGSSPNRVANIYGQFAANLPMYSRAVTSVKQQKPNQIAVLQQSQNVLGKLTQSSAMLQGGGYVGGSTNLATISSAAGGQRQLQKFNHPSGQPQLKHGLGNNGLVDLSFESDNTDLNEEFAFNDSSPSVASSLQKEQQTIFDFSSPSDEENQGSQKSSTSRSDLSLRVQDALRSAPPFSLIKLPSHSHIAIQGFYIKHPLTIVGRPGTIIEIQNGNIVADFRDFLSKHPEHLEKAKLTICETSLIFKYDLMNIVDRVKLLTQIKAINHKSKYMGDSDIKHSMALSDLSNDVDHQDQGLVYAHFQKESPNTLVLPMIVVEEMTTLDIRDCYMRSMRKDTQALPVSNPEAQLKAIKSQYTCEEVGILANPRTWDQKNQFILDILKGTSLPAQVFLRSCIFFNFFDQIRAGVDTSLLMEKCHMSEPRNNSIHSLNPRLLRVIGCNFSKPSRHCVLSEWLPLSSNTEKCRNIVIDGCDLYTSNGTSILIQSVLPEFVSGIDSLRVNFSAHNLKISILNNSITRSKGDGLSIMNMAITTLEIAANEFNLNQMHCIYIKQLHQKSNKCADKNFAYLSIKENKLWQSERGAGCYVVDSGITFQRNQFRGNRLGGLVLSGYTPQINRSSSKVSNGGLTPNPDASRAVQDNEARLLKFLRRYPLATEIHDCEFSLNYSHGCWIEDHWKGPVQFTGCRFTYNQESGLSVKAERTPKNLLFENNNSSTSLSSEINLKRNFNPPTPKQLNKKKNAIQPLNSGLSDSPSKALDAQNYLTQRKSKYIPALSKLACGTVHLIDCEFIENKHNGLSLNSVLTQIKYCTFNSNNGYAIRIVNSDQKQFLRLIYPSEREFKRQVAGFVGGPWGLINYKEATQDMLSNGTNGKSSLNKLSLLNCCMSRQQSIVQPAQHNFTPSSSIRPSSHNMNQDIHLLQLPQQSSQNLYSTQQQQQRPPTRGVPKSGGLEMHMEICNVITDEMMAAERDKEVLNPQMKKKKKYFFFF